MMDVSFINSELIRDTVGLVMTVSLGDDVRPSSPSLALMCDRDAWSSAVTISGQLRCVVIVTCRRSFAHRAAMKMLGAADVDDLLARDVIAEITNVIGGNLKASLVPDAGEPSCLTIPITSTGHITVPRAHRTHEEWCAIDDEIFLVEVIEVAPARFVLGRGA